MSEREGGSERKGGKNLKLIPAIDHDSNMPSE